LKVAVLQDPYFGCLVQVRGQVIEARLVHAEDYGCEMVIDLLNQELSVVHVLTSETFTNGMPSLQERGLLSPCGISFHFA
jgi:hypothetical protein